METRTKALVACSDCDLRVRIPQLEEGQEALCPRCGSRLAARFRGDWQRAGALSLAAVVLFLISVSGPFLLLRSAAGESVSTVWGTPFRLGMFDPVLGIVVAVLFLVLPFAQALLLLRLSVNRLRNGSRDSARRLVKLIECFRPWCMADVFVVGTLVSLIKIVSLARVSFGLSFWAMVGFALVFASAMASFDARSALRAIGGDEQKSHA